MREVKESSLLILSSKRNKEIKKRQKRIIIIIIKNGRKKSTDSLNARPAHHGEKTKISSSSLPSSFETLDRCRQHNIENEIGVGKEQANTVDDRVERVESNNSKLGKRIAEDSKRIEEKQDANSEISSVDLLDRNMLDIWWKQYTERVIIRQKQGQLGEEIQEAIVEEQLDMRAVESSDSNMLDKEQYRERETTVAEEKSIEVRIERVGKQDNKRKEEDESLEQANPEVLSEGSSIELLDRKTLDICLQRYAEGRIREEKGEEKLNKIRVEGFQRYNSYAGNRSEKDSERVEDEQFVNLEVRPDRISIERPDRMTVDNIFKPNRDSDGWVENEQAVGVRITRVGRDNNDGGNGKEESNKEAERINVVAQLELSTLRLLDRKELDKGLEQKVENVSRVRKWQAELVERRGERLEIRDSHCRNRKEEDSKRLEKVEYANSEVELDNNVVELVDRNLLDSYRQHSKNSTIRAEKEQERGAKNSIITTETHRSLGSNRSKGGNVENDNPRIQAETHGAKRIDKRALDRSVQQTIESVVDRRKEERRIVRNRAVRGDIHNSTRDSSQYIEKSGETEAQRSLSTEEESERARSVETGVDSIDSENIEEKIARQRIVDGSERGRESIKIEDDNRVIKREEKVRKAVEERARGNVEVQSESSSVELVDRVMLDRCVQQYRDSIIRVQREEEKRRKVIAKRVEILSKEKVGSHSHNLGESEEEKGDNRMVEVGDRVRIEETGANTEDSNSTSSSIAALFRDERLEREGKKVGRKSVTRRKVWERWRGVVRGEIRRDMRRKKKLEMIEHNQREDEKMVFDFTTKGLSVNEVKLLGRGEAFCIVDHKIDEDRSKVDIYQYQRRLRLHELFRDPGLREVDGREEICTPRAGGENGRVQQARASSAVVRTGERGVNTQTREGRRSIVGTIGRGEGVRGSRGRQGGNIRESVVLGDRQNTSNRSIRTQRRGRRDSGLTVRGIRTSTVGTRNSRESITIREREGDKEGRRLPSIYDPDSQNRNLNRYNTCIQEEIMLVLEDKKVKFIDNITKEEREGLKTLKQRVQEKEIIITRADKGSGLVAIDYDKYISKGTKYIEEEAGAYSIAQESEQEIIGRLTKERNKIAEKLKDTGVIGGQTATYIKKQLEEKITGIKFYYKIHKDRRIDSMPLRPLQSCIKSPIQHLSIILTDILQPLLNDSNIQSFIFDSNQLLYRLKKLGSIPYGCTIISSDVSALYPSIPHEEGFKAMEEFLIEYTSYDSQQVASIIRALKLVITENYMSWNSQIYKQTSGVAMGTPVAVAYANIFMNWVDREVRSKAPFIHEHIRYIDDNLFIVLVDRVEQLMEIANNILPPYIKFTYEKLEVSSGKGLPFLDTQLFIAIDNSIESRLYTKATDRHAYLLPSSYHPPHVTKNIPSAVFGRVRKICSREEWFEEDAQKAVGWLSNRGYKDRDIHKALSKVRFKDRWELIEKIESNRKINTQKKEEIEVDIPLIITYNQHVGKIRQVLKDRQPLLDSAFRRTKVKPRLSFRRKRNLNDIIVQKGLRGPIEQNRGDLNIFNKCVEKCRATGLDARAKESIVIVYVDVACIVKVR